MVDQDSPISIIQSATTNCQRRDGAQKIDETCTCTSTSKFEQITDVGSSIAQKVSPERFSTREDTRSDMIASFIRHGLTRRELESEVLLQM